MQRALITGGAGFIAREGAYVCAGCAPQRRLHPQARPALALGAALSASPRLVVTGQCGLGDIRHKPLPEDRLDAANAERARGMMGAASVS